MKKPTDKPPSSNMYTGAKTWNPFKGCGFDCVYCRPSFQAQAKRQLHNCRKCYDFVPHAHPERLSKIPRADLIFACGNGDLSFAAPEYTQRVIEAIRERGKSRTFYLQSKRPEVFAPFLGSLPANVILVTTLETNRDDGYREISKAPPPSERYRQFLALDYPRKVLTIEPVMDFDLDVFVGWILQLRPEYVWVDYNSRPKQVQLPEPSVDKLKAFTQALTSANILIKNRCRSPSLIQV